jgi:hypothetical protein
MIKNSKENSFLEKLLEATRFISTSYPIDFLPRKVGLGFNLKVEGLNRNVLKPVIKKIKKREYQLTAKEVKGESSSEDIDRISFILKKSKKGNRQ